MCFDIDVSKLTLEELRDTLRRITMVLSKPVVVDNLPDKGHQLRQAKEKLEKEIKFRESLERTRRVMQKLSLKCASETNIANVHCAKLCSIEKKPERERFKPHLSLRQSGSGRTESVKNLHSGTKLIDLTTSLSLQKTQEERVKAGQVKGKQERLMALMKKKEEDDDESDSDESEFSLSDYMNESEGEEAEPVDDDVVLKKDVMKVLKQVEQIIDMPGPSGVKFIRAPKPLTPDEEIQSTADTTEREVMELEKEPEKPEQTIQPIDNAANDTTKLKAEAMESENEPEKLEKEVQPKNDAVEPKKEPEKSEEKMQHNADSGKLAAKFMDLEKEPLELEDNTDAA